MDFINIKPQEGPHFSATIFLSEDEVLRLIEVLKDLEYGEFTSCLETFNSDGEAYTLFVCLPSDQESAKLQPHYIGADYKQQPSPVRNDTPSIHDELLAMPLPDGLAEMLKQRKAKGMATYGVPLQRGNGRDAMQDCKEEIADAIAYAEQMGDSNLRESLIAVWEDHCSG